MKDKKLEKPCSYEEFKSSLTKRSQGYQDNSLTLIYIQMEILRELKYQREMKEKKC